MKENQKLLKENQQLKERIEKRQKEDANTILILQNEKKMLEAEAVKYVQEVNEEKQNLQTQISLLERNVAEQKAEIQRVQEDKSSLMEEIQQLKKEKEQIEKLQKEDANIILILQNEKKMLEAEAVKHVQEVNVEKQNLQTQISLLEKNVDEQKEKIIALEKRQKEASELAKMKNEYDLQIKEIMDDLKNEKDALQRVEDKLDEYKLLVAEKDEVIEKAKNKMDAKILEYETLLEKTWAEHKKQENIHKETCDIQIAQIKKEYDLKIEELMNDLKKANEKVEDKQSVVQMDSDFNASFGGGDYTNPETEGNQTIDLTDSLVEDHVESEVRIAETGNGSDDDAIQPEENSIIKRRKRKLLDPTQTCNLGDVSVNDKIDYKRLNGKTLSVHRLRYSNRRWYIWHVQGAAERKEIEFEQYDFKIFPQFELVLNNHENISSIVNRIVCSNLKDLQLNKMTILFSDFKKLTANKIFSFHIFRSTVVKNDENGIKVGIDKLWKEVGNAETLEHNFCDGEVITTEIAQKLAALPKFPNLLNVYLWNVQEGFDLETFGEFIRKNPTIVNCELNFGKVSVEFSQEMKRIKENLSSTLPLTCRLLKY